MATFCYEAFMNFGICNCKVLMEQVHTVLILVTKRLATFCIKHIPNKTVLKRYYFCSKHIAILHLNLENYYREFFAPTHDLAIPHFV